MGEPLTALADMIPVLWLSFFSRLRDRLFVPRVPLLFGEEYSVEWVGPTGEQLLFFCRHDAWFYGVPGQGARRVYIGMGEDFNEEVLRQKFGYQHLFDAYITTFDEVRAVYIDPADPFVGGPMV